MEENKEIRIPLREDYRNGDLLRGRDVNKITHRVNELTGDIDKIDIDLSGKLDTSAYTEDKAAIESRIDGVVEGLSANTTAITQLQTSKQDKLTAGSGITIDENNVISAEVPDLSEYATTGYVDTQITQHTLSGSNNVDITNNVVSAKGYVYNQKWNIFLGNTVEELGTNTFTNNGHVILGKGTGNRIQGESQIIFGNANTASTIYSSHSVVFGDENRLADDAFIYGSRNGTNGASVFIVGDGNSIAADWSVAIGQRLRTSHKNEFAIGLGNVTHKTNQGTEYTGLSGDTLLSIGNGRTDFSNAIELMEDGTLYIEGIGNYNGTQIASGDNNVKSLQMVVSGIHDSISAKQDQLTAGSGITIDENNVISAQQQDLSPYALSADVATELATKVDTSAYTQDKAAIQASIDEKVATTAFTAYTASTNDTLQGHGGRLDGHDTKIGNLEDNKLDSSAYTEDRAALVTVIDRKAESSALTAYTASTQETITGITNSITNLQNGKQNKLTAGTNITIVNDVISAQQPDLSPYALSADVTTELSKKVDTTAYTQDKAAMQASISANTTAITQLQQSKQNNLSAGTGIQIQNDVISLTGAGGAQIDDTVTGTTTTWSSQKIMEEMRITLTNLLPNGNVLAL